MDNQKAKELLDKYKKGQCTPDEVALLESWYLELPMEYELDLSEAKLQTTLNEIRSSLPHLQTSNKGIKLWPRFIAAASVVLCLFVGSYFLLPGKKPSQETKQKHDVLPGGNKATLTLASGEKIILNSAPNGQLAKQKGISIAKATDGILVYSTSPGHNLNSSLMEYNLAETPRSGQYEVNLSDGTRVWLNSASSLRYPTQFKGKERVVELTGEAYFEVAHNAAMPFKVRSGKQTVEVLGTHFDVNTYADEPSVKTTLLEGSVRITAGLETAILEPGRQAFFTSGNLQTKIVDTDDVIAWKNGLFSFTDANLESIMREVARWYDVEIVYGNDKIRQLLCNGIVTRFSNVSTVLLMMERTKQVHFKIEGKKIIVMSGESSPVLNN